ncbi:helix-turn-helix domain protein [Clostridium argentinense CDC 2741]|uniref:Helix-turn-helix domain protein n=1 Tax=Clostridium argentinense CDC 2741 TaxID=1418104 RepID=A0A0C1R1V0_9CLOT|nr:AraC family transcriptional regulator [Clostridium argentinense]ARC84342.1 AraC family transcriptional regulator [Clostridium argentinense]KIE44416.1 helix-turn-helix domain protein [Clostridium argentinense CDC 2741]NFF38310.1 helix-turn-helix transcriptional regulator [Clostridium argentinense]NFP49106.1 helix-turn-helix transcriptional regulator [Clostridium argentinense]NFP71614.1 helix-turn-helix transcriptional regulator [Clostridium argentinense]
MRENIYIFYSDDHISFITNKIDASLHIHNSIQITVSIEEKFSVKIKNNIINESGIIINSNVSHELFGKDGWQIYFLINPESIFGEKIKRMYMKNKDFYIIPEDATEAIRELVKEKHIAIDNKAKYNKFISEIYSILSLENYTINHLLDERVDKVLKYIANNNLTEISLESLSKSVFLSESRLSHLFKENIGISISSYILNYKVRKAFKLIFEGYSITTSALEAGFYSSSHLTNVCKEKLGMIPSAIRKNSRYLQVNNY